MMRSARLYGALALLAVTAVAGIAGRPRPSDAKETAIRVRDALDKILQGAASGDSR